jgi:type IV pilus assembly protein PilW
MRRLTRPASAACLRRRARGLSLVELMVGVAVGLLVVAAATFVAVNQLGDTRRLLLETQVQQDLRAAADLMARDLRRAEYWGRAEAGVWYTGGPDVAGNPYVSIDAQAQEVTYAYSRDPGGAEDDAIDDDRERFGYKLENGTIKMRVGRAWQELTDPNVLKVTRFEVTPNGEDAAQSCFKLCADGTTACWPKQEVRRLSVMVEGVAVSDALVKRSVRSNVRLRNDATSGACPA